MEVEAAAAAPSGGALPASGPTVTPTRVNVSLRTITGGGAHTQAHVASVLRVNDVTILLDCGWNESFSESYVSSLRAIAGDVDVILLSHADVAHAGALPYVLAHAAARHTPGPTAAAEDSATADAGAVKPLRKLPRVFGTHAVHRMAQMYLYDAVLSRLILNPDFSGLTLDMVDAAFKLAAFEGPFNTLRYNEEVRIGDVSLVAHASGHSVGGAMWVISCATEAIVYCTDIHLRTEMHLPPADIAALPRRPTALITDAMSAVTPSMAPGAVLSITDTAAQGVAPSQTAEARGDAAAEDSDTRLEQLTTALVEAVLNPVRQGGSVLLPTDTAGRALEILARLESKWDAEYHPLVFFNPVAKNIVDFARISLDYMSERLTRSFTDEQRMYFQFKSVKIISSETELEKYLRTPVVVIASWPSLSLGFSRKLFMKWAADARNLILFTDPLNVVTGTVAATLLSSHPPPPNVLVEIVERVPLAGTELRKWYEQKEEQAREARRVAETARAREAEAAEMRASAGESRDSGEAAAASAAASAAATALAAAKATRDAAVYSDDEDAIDDRALKAMMSAAGSKQMSSAALAIARMKVLQQRFAVFAVDDSARKMAVTPYGQLVNYDAMTAQLAAQAPPTAAAAAVGGLLGAAPSASTSGEYTDDLSAAAAARIDQVNRMSGAKAGASIHDMLDAPTKAVRRMETVRVSCRVQVLDLGGRIDATSLTHVIEDLQPMRVVLVRGTQEARDKLALQLSPHCDQVLASTHGDAVDLSSDTASFMARLRDDVLAGVSLRRVGGWEVAHVYGRLGIHSTASSTSSTYADPGMVWLTRSVADADHEPFMLRAGAVRIPDIRKRLTRAGITTDMIEGGLVTSGGVIIRRTSSWEDPSSETGVEEASVPPGHGIEIEGVPSSEYYRVRAALYEMYSRV